MELIDKDVVVAEIERRHENLVRTMNKLYYASNYNEWKAVVNEYRSLMCYVNTLEVKEVDLDYIKKELDELIKHNKPNGDFGWGTLYNVAVYFIELGFKAKSIFGNNDSNPSYKKALKFIEDNTQVRYYEDRDSEGFRRGLDLEKEYYVKPNIAKEAVEIAMGHKETD